MPTPDPMTKTAEAVARDSFMQPDPEPEEAVRERCRREGVAYQEVAGYLERYRAESDKTCPPGAGEEGNYLEGKFEINEPGGISGGQGVIRFGREKSTGRAVAVKRIRLFAGDTLDERGRPREVAVGERVERQTPTLRRNLVDFLAHGYWDAADRDASERAYSVVMPRAGKTLADVLANGPVAPDEACRLVSVLAAVVDGLHAQAAPVIHRDLKPANVLLYPAEIDDPPETVWACSGVRYRPVVTDLGMAKWTAPAGNASLTLAERGTLNYMAPEQHHGGHLTPSVDIYALGVILAECVTGKVPFDFRDTAKGKAAPTEFDLSVRASVLRTPAPPLGSLAADKRFDPRLDRVVRKCLRKAPSRRYTSGEKLCDDLRRLLDAGKPAVEAESLGRRVDEQDRTEGDQLYGRERRWRKRWRRVTVGLALAAAFGMGLAVLLWVKELDRQQKEATQEQTARYERRLLRARVLWEHSPGQALEELHHEADCPPAARDERWQDLTLLCRQLKGLDRRPTLGLHGPPHYGVAVSPDGKRVVRAVPIPGRLPTPTEYKVELASVGAEKPTWAWPPSKLPGVMLGNTAAWSEGLIHMAFSPDGRRLVVAEQDPTGHLRLIRAAADGGETDAPLVLGQVAPLITLAWLPGDVLVYAYRSMDGRGTGQVLHVAAVSAADATPRFHVTHPETRVQAMSFSADGTRYCTAEVRADPLRPNAAKWWVTVRDTRNGEINHQWPLDFPISGSLLEPAERMTVALSGDGTRLGWSWRNPKRSEPAIVSTRRLDDREE